MTNINQLSSLDTIQLGDLLAVWATNNGDTRKASMSLMLSFIQNNLTLPGTTTTQYAAPSATGFSVTVSAVDTWLLLMPTATFASGTIVLPSAPTDRSEVSVNCTQIVMSLTVSGAGKTVTGLPTFMAMANSFFTMRFDAITNAWYRVS